MTTSGERYVRTRELSQLVGLSIPTLEAWRQSGKGPEWIRLAGRTIVYPLSGVQAFLAQQREATERGRAATAA